MQRGQAVLRLRDLLGGFGKCTNGQFVGFLGPLVAHVVGDAVDQEGHVVGHVAGEFRVGVEDLYADGPKSRQVCTHVAAVGQGHVGLGSGFRGVDVVMGVQVVLLDDSVADAVRIQDLEQALGVFRLAERQEVVLFGLFEKLFPQTVLRRGKHDHRALVILVEHEGHA